ncbi:interleukin-6 receptor subunit beta [Embiotoca jacksoni]|uniref:interleukin-6 receptor subunit beta n=1 Tax=Embiotoca jacksoni TaxID=100190 RepID=UPI003703E022
MVTATLLLLLSVLLPADMASHLMVTPQVAVLQVGQNFTATCVITDTNEVTSDDLYWNVSKTTVLPEHYTKINRTALAVTVTISSEDCPWLFCLCRKVSPYVVLNGGKFIHGVRLVSGYAPERPENLSCVAVQENTYISPSITCEWEAAGRQTTAVPTTNTLFVRKIITGETFNASARANSAKVSMPIFPSFATLEIWVEARNKLGALESEHLVHDANYFVKTNPPADVKVISEKTFPTSLLINWTHPIAKEYVKLIYEIRFCPKGSHMWTYVPPADTGKDIQSFRLQNLQPDTVYVTQVRCKNSKKDHGHWSSWSTNATKRTPEDRPAGKPDLWRITTEGGINERQVEFICKDPEFANGRIIRFDITFQKTKKKVSNGSWEQASVPVNRSEWDRSARREITLLKNIQLADDRSVTMKVTAVNSVGESAKALLVIPAKAHRHPPVEELKVRPHAGRLLLDWKPPNVTAEYEYVVEWISGGQIDWQRENSSTRHTAIEGNLEPFVCYNVSVYPVYFGRIGKPARVEAFLEQGAPLHAPTIRLKGNPGHNEAELVWEEIPQSSRRGFITNYTIFYSSGAEMHMITVPANATSYTLKSLSRSTKYDIRMKASTVKGSASGFNHSFTTLKYAPGEIEGIVVGVSFGFLFVVLMTMLLCIYKKDMIKDNFWPQIPNPKESTIGHWSPDYPLKAETPKESCLSGISVLDVDVCDAKCVFEEDKAGLPLKKDKYLSEEHSSGIGGSSCMSSPRQSVSDSDEGGDMADTTASTVQYSSVVASSGYKGQTPASQPPPSIFSRSESTQPLLDSEENPDVSLPDGGRAFQRFSKQPSFTHGAGGDNPNGFTQLEMEQQEALEALDFCPLEEDGEGTAASDGPSAAAASSYMPQLGGYRPQ